jgi:hypothetical protein
MRYFKKYKAGEISILLSAENIDSKISVLKTKSDGWDPAVKG